MNLGMDEKSGMVKAEMDLAFETGKVIEAPPEKLAEWLQHLCSASVRNGGVQPREIIRGLTINHIQMARTIQSVEETMRNLNASNDATQKRVVVLTWVALAVGMVQMLCALAPFFR
ncbi:MAG: hypothetical protein J0M24_10730 [Verrucomicrobia bacterium]|nr:hypothetical protein [Verrucomicrobiota bacterium]